ncbi:hypothetical protein SAY86_009534 [Trapa natans]|uniref:NAC domain-containing protein n=1 Tax=Trapa natans TaxID=22666 RepID=A0AAN7KZW3_TRANT|nr:hypothetical protein SAY86_009534 [Trapa natans]
MAVPELRLPGFRFHPTEQELLEHYLKNMAIGRTDCYSVIGFLDIYRHSPWELPGLAMNNGEREWYFFVPRDMKAGRGGRPNRTTDKGFWKATGSDRRIFSTLDQRRRRVIGLRKTLVFYMGRAPQGDKTDWIMNEYRFPDDSSLPKDAVLCKIYRKATSLKVLEQRAAIEEEFKQSNYQSTDMDTSPTCRFQHYLLDFDDDAVETKEPNAVIEDKQRQDSSSSSSSPSSPFPSLKVPLEGEKLTELQVPKFMLDWTQDSFWAQLNSPWLQAPTPDHTNLAHF